MVNLMEWKEQVEERVSSVEAALAEAVARIARLEGASAGGAGVTDIALETRAPDIVADAQALVTVPGAEELLATIVKRHTNELLAIAEKQCENPQKAEELLASAVKRLAEELLASQEVAEERGRERSAPPPSETSSEAEHDLSARKQFAGQKESCCDKLGPNENDSRAKEPQKVQKSDAIQVAEDETQPLDRGAEQHRTQNSKAEELATREREAPEVLAKRNHGVSELTEVSVSGYAGLSKAPCDLSPSDSTVLDVASCKAIATTSGEKDVTDEGDTGHHNCQGHAAGSRDGDWNDLRRDNDHESVDGDDDGLRENCDQDREDEDTMSLSLHDAALLGHLIVLQSWLAQGTDPNGRDDRGDTPLLCAARGGHVTAVRALLEHGARANARGFGLQMALHAAAEGGHADVARALLEAGARVDAKDVFGFCPLAVAVTKGRAQVVEALLQKGANPNACDATGTRVLLLAVANRELQIAHMLLQKKADPDIQYSNGETPLVIAVKSQHLDLVRMLLEAKANPNIFESKSPVFLAAKNRNNDILKILLKCGAKPDTCKSEGYTALHIAVKAGNIDIVKTLLNHGANPENTNNARRSVLWEAVNCGNVNLVWILLNAAPHIAHNDTGVAALQCAVSKCDATVLKALCQAGGYPITHMKSHQKLDLLQGAVKAGSKDCVSVLLQAGVDADTEVWNKALCLALQKKQVEIIQMLLKDDADVSREVAREVMHMNEVKILKEFLERSKDFANTTVYYDFKDPWTHYQNSTLGSLLHYACVHRLKNSVAALLEYGVDVEARDARGYKPLHHAVIKDDAEIVQLLICADADSGAVLTKSSNIYVGRYNSSSEIRPVDIACSKTVRDLLSNASGK